MAKVILGFTGLISCGKGTAAEYVVTAYHGSSHRFSTMLRDVLSRLYLEQSRSNMQNISTLLRQQFGEDLLAKVMSQDVSHDEHDYIAVEGIRRMADIEYLRQLPGFFLISIEADPRIRYQRLTARSENTDDTAKTWEQFLADQQAEADQDIPKVMAEADVTISNDGSMEEFYSQIDAVIKQISHDHKI